MATPQMIDPYLTAGDRKAMAERDGSAERERQRTAARDKERAAVVEYIRGWAAPMDSVYEQGIRDLLFEIAGNIRDGEHAEDDET